MSTSKSTSTSRSNVWSNCSPMLHCIEYELCTSLSVLNIHKDVHDIFVYKSTVDYYYDKTKDVQICSDHADQCLLHTLKHSSM